MKKKYYETASFNKEQKEWYKKLKEDGFEDIEYLGANGEIYGNRLKRQGACSTDINLVSTEYTIYQTPLSTENTRTKGLNAVLCDPMNAEFYRLCGRFLHLYKFKNPFEYRIFELFSDGKTYRQIVKNLKNEWPTKNIAISSIFKIVKKLLKHMTRNASFYSLTDEELEAKCHENQEVSSKNMIT